MTECVFAYCMGKLVSHLLDTLADVVFAKEDIAAKDSEVMVDVFSKLLDRLENVMQVNCTHRKSQASLVAIVNVTYSRSVTSQRYTAYVPRPTTGCRKSASV